MFVYSPIVTKNNLKNGKSKLQVSGCEAGFNLKKLQ